MLISAVIPISSFNYRLDRLLSWLPSEADEDCEFILVHDTSNPEFDRHLLSNIQAKTASDIKFIEGDFGNPGSARNAGLKIAGGDWVAFWDSDDVVNVEEVKKLVRLAQENSSDIAIAPFELLRDKQDKQLVPLNSGEPKDISKQPGIWRFVFRRDVIGGLEFPELKMGEDQVFLLSCHLFTWRIYVGNKPTYSYFAGNSGQLTTHLNGVEDLLQAFKLSHSIYLSSVGRDKELSKRLMFRQILSLLKYREKMTPNISFEDATLQFLKFPVISLIEALRIVGSKYFG